MLSGQNCTHEAVLSRIAFDPMTTSKVVRNSDFDMDSVEEYKGDNSGTGLTCLQCPCVTLIPLACPSSTLTYPTAKTVAWAAAETSLAASMLSGLPARSFDMGHSIPSDSQAGWISKPLSGPLSNLFDTCTHIKITHCRLLSFSHFYICIRELAAYRAHFGGEEGQRKCGKADS